MITEPDLVATFTVTRGSFTIPTAMLAEDADDWELRRLFARSLPEVAPSDVLSTTRAMLKGGDVVVLWRRIVTNYRPA